MSDAIPSYGFTAARRGYAPEQVDRALAALTAQRDAAWQRLSQLGARIRDLETALETARQEAAEAPAPDYTALSEQAADLMAIAENEARNIRDKAERFAEDTRDDTYQAARRRSSPPRSSPPPPGPRPTRPPAGPMSAAAPRPSGCAARPTETPAPSATPPPPRPPSCGSPPPRPASGPRPSWPSCAARPTSGSPPRRPPPRLRTPRARRSPSSA